MRSCATVSRPPKAVVSRRKPRATRPAPSWRRHCARATTAAGTREVMHTAIAAAEVAVLAAAPLPTGADDGPSCTFVAGVWDGEEVTVGSVGDSRAYWVGRTTSLRLTVDDSWAQEQVDAGTMTEPAAMSAPDTHVITRWLGPDAPEGPYRVHALRPREPGRLILCSDGLWQYASSPAELRELVELLLPIDDLAALAHRPRAGGMWSRGRRQRHRRGHRRRSGPCTTGGNGVSAFSVETYQNEYLPIGATEVDAIVSITHGGGDGTPAERPEAAEILLLDVSGSMAGDRKLELAKRAAAAAIDELPDDVRFAVVAGNDRARMVFPQFRRLARASEATRAQAKSAITSLNAGSGTAIGTWLARAADLFAKSRARSVTRSC